MKANLFFQANNLNVDVRVNGKTIATLYREIDGYFVCAFKDETANSAWPAYLLRAISDKLNELNEPWNDLVNLCFESHPTSSDSILSASHL